MEPLFEWVETPVGNWRLIPRHEGYKPGAVAIAIAHKTIGKYAGIAFNRGSMCDTMFPPEYTLKEIKRILETTVALREGG